MKTTILKPQLRTAFAAAAAFAIGVLGLAACSDSATFAVEPGDYTIIGTYTTSTLSSGTEGYVYAPVTIAEDHTITGTGKLYTDTYVITTVQDPDDTTDITGEVTSDGLTLDFDADVSATATVAADGTITATLTHATDETFVGFARILPTPASDVAIGCGYFYFSDLPTVYQGTAMYLATEAGDLFGVMGGNYDEPGTFTGTMDATWTPGIFCGSDTCAGELTGSISGATDDGTAVTLDIDTSDVYWEGGDPNYLYLGNEGFSNATYDGFYRGDSYHCTNLGYD